VNRRPLIWPKLSRWLPWLAFAIILAVTLQLRKNEQQHATDALQTDFNFRVRETGARIEQRMLAYEQQLRGVQGLFASSKSVSRSAFRTFFNKLNLDQNFPGIQGVGYAQVIPLAQKDKFTTSVRNEGFPAFSIWPVSDRSIFTSIIYIEPFSVINQRPFGYDMYTEPLRRAAMVQARDNDMAALSGPIKLVADIKGHEQVGFKMYMPIYKNGAPHDTLANRRVNLLGWVYALFRANDLMSGILGEHVTDIDIEIFDGNKPSEKTLMYDADHVRRAFGTEKPLFQSFQELEIAGHAWTMVVSSHPTFEAQLDQSKPRFVTIVGSSIGLALLLVWLLVQERARAVQASREISEELNELKIAQARVIRLSQLYQALSETNQAIVRMKQQTELFPLVCRCAVEFGGMKLAWIGQLNEESGLIAPIASYGFGQDYLTDITISSRADMPEGLGPTGTALRENRTVIINNFSGDSRTLPWQARAAKYGWNSCAAFPIQRGGQPFAVLSVYHEQTNAFNEEAIALLDEMTMNISFALDNFDHEVQRQLAQESLLLAASVYEVSSEAMMVTDADNNILSINPSFTRIMEYTPEEIIGKNAKILYSDVGNNKLNKEIWKEVTATGQWKGELWNKRKNGETFLELLTINTIYQENGSVHRRVALFSDITQRKQSEDLIWKQANFDLLTELPNRQLFHDRLNQEIRKAQRAGQALAVLFLDLDRFKEVNDTFGHSMGDIMLKEAARRLIGCVRATDTVARLGGDEFIIILGNLNHPTNVERVVRNILQKLAEPFQLGDDVAYVSASIGITLYPDDATDIDILLKNADQAMYTAKDQGRNRYQYFTASMQETAQAKKRLTIDLRDAVANSEFILYYQPIIELATGAIYKAEALIRWQHPTRGLVSPIEFIPIAEETGMINDIGNWVFTEAAKQVKLWRASHHAAFQISVNKSPVQFHATGNTHVDWIDYLRQLDLPGQSIAVEITEGLLLQARTTVTEQLLEFRNAGMQISIDDFGTGYSSLSYLKKFDIDYVKIDQSFTGNLKPGSSDMVLCEAIIVMAHKLGMKVIAEGVETEGQRDLLLAAGCDYAQGYLYSKPVPAAEFEKLLKGVSRK
jgi:diguanylate cyclase (GGDEF)-like protein/PAS domain S-box-containing protein